MVQINKQEAQRNSGLFLLKKIGLTFIDLVFPPACSNCGRVDSFFCDSCLKELATIELNPQFTEKSPLSSIVSTGLHQGLLQEAVQALKYHQGLVLAPILAHRLSTCLKQTNWTFDTIIPVPISTQRLQERGYNQAKELSQLLAEQLNITHLPQALQKIRHTASQVGLSREERLINLENAYQADANLIRGKDLLLVDDVKTTGTTLAECAQTALNTGAKSVYAITITAAI